MLLRPHQEVRKLTRGDFNEDLSLIILKGKNTKNGKNRQVPVPPYVLDQLHEFQSHSLPDSYNIFSKSIKPFGVYYLSTAWSRVKTRCSERG